jgi:hypothetical protein
MPAKKQASKPAGDPDDYIALSQLLLQLRVKHFSCRRYTSSKAAADRDAASRTLGARLKTAEANLRRLKVRRLFFNTVGNACNQPLIACAHADCAKPY